MSYNGKRTREQEEEEVPEAQKKKLIDVTNQTSNNSNISIMSGVEDINQDDLMIDEDNSYVNTEENSEQNVRENEKIGLEDNNENEKNQNLIISEVPGLIIENIIDNVDDMEKIDKNKIDRKDEIRADQSEHYENDSADDKSEYEVSISNSDSGVSYTPDSTISTETSISSNEPNLIPRMINNCIVLVPENLAMLPPDADEIRIIGEYQRSIGMAITTEGGTGARTRPNSTTITINHDLKKEPSDTEQNTSVTDQDSSILAGATTNEPSDTEQNTSITEQDSSILAGATTNTPPEVSFMNSTDSSENRFLIAATEHANSTIMDDATEDLNVRMTILAGATTNTPPEISFMNSTDSSENRFLIAAAEHANSTIMDDAAENLDVRMTILARTTTNTPPEVSFMNSTDSSENRFLIAAAEHANSTIMDEDADNLDVRMTMNDSDKSEKFNKEQQEDRNDNNKEHDQLMSATQIVDFISAESNHILYEANILNESEKSSTTSESNTSETTNKDSSNIF